MANAKITDLPVAISIDGSEYAEIVQAGTSKRVALQLIGNLASGFVPTSTQIIAGDALNGGGPLSGDVTLNVDFEAPGSFGVIDNLPEISPTPPDPLADYFMVSDASGSVVRKVNSSSIGLSLGNLAAGGATGQTLVKLSATNYDADWGTLGVAGGGTGHNTYAVGDILYASTTSALSRLADVATGNALISGGVGVAPSWGKIGLSSHVSGTLPIANGGTGQGAALDAFDALCPTTTRGDLITRDATNNVRLPVGGANTLLSSDGTDPSWANAATVKGIIGIPTTTVDNTLPRFDGTGGDLQTSGITVDDSNNLSGVNNVTGADTDFVTGTVGTNGNLAQWNADGDIVDSGAAAADFLTSSDIGTTVQGYAANLDGWSSEDPTDYSTTSEIAAAYQPLDSDLTAIAALSTTAAGRSTLTITDPNADRVIAWDDSAGAVAPIALADISAEASPAAGDFLLMYRAEGDLAKVDWDDLPSGGGGENLLVNGDFQINQREFAGGALADGDYGHDRWKAAVGGGGASYSVSGFVVTIASGTLQQIVEPGLWGLSSFANSTITVSTENPSADLAVGFGSQNGVIPAGAGRQSATLNLGSGDTGNLAFSIAANSAGSVSFGRVKLEIGSAATEWQARDGAAEFALCERYLVRFGGMSIYERIGIGFFSSTTRCHGFVTFATKMRTLPSLIASNPSHFAAYDGGTVFPAESVNVDTMGDKTANLWVGVTGATTTRAGQLITNNTTAARLYFDAEL